MLEDEPEDFVDPYLNQFDAEDEEWDEDFEGGLFPEQREF